ncbi:aspartyl protease [Saccharomycopsis crataegensis]|uniref:Aspartyl protease n=1 Tax=Saccharomycopsis crataegensis TaxID=43959 RepID=A0AAV5QUS1_9ASCO|nr:aspartyl protease [Saccharomycopsis crataegensis]
MVSTLNLSSMLLLLGYLGSAAAAAAAAEHNTSSSLLSAGPIKIAFQVTRIDESKIKTMDNIPNKILRNRRRKFRQQDYVASALTSDISAAAVTYGADDLLPESMFSPETSSETMSFLDFSDLVSELISPDAHTRSTETVAPLISITAEGTTPNSGPSYSSLALSSTLSTNIISDTTLKTSAASFSASISKSSSSGIISDTTLKTSTASLSVFTSKASASSSTFTSKTSSSSSYSGSSASNTYDTSSATSSGVAVSIENEYSMYIATILLGTPGQTIEVDLDTGSSDLWVPGYGTQSDYGTYSSIASSTYQFKKAGFSITYGDGSSATGNWVTDTLTLGDVSITQMEFGDATIQTAGQGVFGIGMIGNEAAQGFTYDNFPVMLKNQGYINSVCYSLYLGSTDADSGEVLFGAIDHAKYSGNLGTLAIQDVDDAGDTTSEPVAFFVNLNGVSNADSETFASTSYPALLDSGTTLFYAPTAITESIGNYYGGTYSAILGGYVISCDATGADLKLSFDDNLTITVPFSDLVFSLSSSECILGVMDSDEDIYILGDVVLRSAYVFYDIENSYIKMAQVLYTDDTDIEMM